MQYRVHIKYQDEDKPFNVDQRRRKTVWVHAESQEKAEKKVLKDNPKFNTVVFTEIIH